MSNELDSLQNEVDYWYSVASMYMDNPLKQDEFEYAKQRLSEVVGARDRAKAEAE